MRSAAREGRVQPPSGQVTGDTGFAGHRRGGLTIAAATSARMLNQGRNEQHEDGIDAVVGESSRSRTLP